MDLVEGAGDLADLVLAPQRDRADRGVDPLRVGLGQLVDQLGQAVVGDVERGGVQGPHAEDHRAGDVAGEQTGQHQRGDHDQRVEDPVGERPVLDVLGVGDDLVEQLALGRAQRAHVALGGLVPQRAGQAVGAGRVDDPGGGVAVGGGGGQLTGVGHADHQQRAHGGHGVAVRHAQRQALVGGGLGDLGVRVDLHLFAAGGRVELVAGGLLQLVGDHQGLDQVLALVAVHAADAEADQQVQHQRALGRGGGLGQRHRVDRAALGGDVGGAEADGVVHRQQRREHHRVRVGGRGREQLLAVGVLPQVRQRLDHRLELRVAARDRRVVLDLGEAGAVVGQRLVGPVAELLHLALVALAGEQRHQALVALLFQRVGQLGRGARHLRDAHRAVGLGVVVQRGVDAQAAEDQRDHHGDHQDGDQTGRHPPVQRGQEVGPAGGAALRGLLGAAGPLGRLDGRGGALRLAAVLGRGERGELTGGLAASRFLLAGL